MILALLTQRPAPAWAVTIRRSESAHRRLTLWAMRDGNPPPPRVVRMLCETREHAEAEYGRILGSLAYLDAMGLAELAPESVYIEYTGA